LLAKPSCLMSYLLVEKGRTPGLKWLKWLGRRRGAATGVPQRGKIRKWRG
jgi:hypothetical protein